jgi:hypothetical protein
MVVIQQSSRTEFFISSINQNADGSAQLNSAYQQKMR